ncbi:MAG: acetate--CoA ligase family protein [Bacillota bacterium]
MAVRTEARQTLDEIMATCRAEGRRQLTEWETYAILRQWQVPVAPCELVQEPSEAAQAALRLGGKLAVKVVSPEIGHKTEAGCVRLNLSGPMQVEAACIEVLANAQEHAPDARIDGILVQRMAPPGVEVILGGLQDPSFGPVVMVGLGGIFTEVMKDVSFRLAPVGEEQALAMLQELKGFPLLTGVRGKPPVDLMALSRTLMAVSQLLSSWPDLQELDLNPLIAYQHGVMAVDGLATLRA